MNKITLVLDSSSATEILSSLAESAKAFPEIGDRLVEIFESGEEAFLLQCDCRPATRANEIIVRLYPSNRLLGLVAAFRAGEPEFLFAEHPCLPSSVADFSTTGEGRQR